MTYIWINPVSESMYDGSVLGRFLREYGLVWVRCKTDWGRNVKEKYIKQVERCGDTLADARCPMACGLVRNLLEGDRKGKNGLQERAGEAENRPKLMVADIEPILIHCAREISGREDLRDGNKIITTPCKALADMGNALDLKDTCFITWNGFLDTLAERPRGKALEASPIPPGFFSSLEERTESLTGKAAIERYVRDKSWKRVRLVEMLYCDRGCHNGDGVVRDEY